MYTYLNAVLQMPSAPKDFAAKAVRLGRLPVARTFLHFDTRSVVLRR